jgi:hypothetical protein
MLDPLHPPPPPPFPEIRCIIAPRRISPIVENAMFFRTTAIFSQALSARVSGHTHHLEKTPS